MAGDRESTESEPGSEYETDSECDYNMDIDACNAACTDGKVSVNAINEMFKRQRGICRISGLPFATCSPYQAVVARRKLNEKLCDDNFVLVLDSIEKMRAATGMSWRVFVRFLQVIGKDAEL